MSKTSSKLSEKKALLCVESVAIARRRIADEIPTDPLCWVVVLFILILLPYVVGFVSVALISRTYNK